MTGKGELFVEVFEGEPEWNSSKKLITEKSYKNQFVGATNIDTEGKGANWKSFTGKSVKAGSKLYFVVFDERNGKGKGEVIGKYVDDKAKVSKEVVGWNYATVEDLKKKEKEGGLTLDADKTKKKKGTLTITVTGLPSSSSSDKDKEKAGSRDIKTPSSKDKDHKSSKDDHHKDDHKSSSSRDKGKEGAYSDKESIEYLQKLAGYQVQLAEKKCSDARNEVQQARELLARLERLQPRRTPGSLANDSARPSTSSYDRDLYRGERAISPLRRYYDSEDEFEDEMLRRSRSRPRSYYPPPMSMSDRYDFPPPPPLPMRTVIGPAPPIGLGGPVPLRGPIYSGIY